MADTLDVLTLTEGKTAVGIASSDTSQDTPLAAKITAVSRRLDQLVGPVVRRTITGEVHEGGRHEIRVRFYPVYSFTTVTEYRDTNATVLTLEDYDTQPADAYVPERWSTSTAVYNGCVERRSNGWRYTFPPGPEAVRVTYVAGRYADTASVDALFKEAAGVMLKNSWRPTEASALLVGEFEVPAQNFPRFGVPNYVRDLLADEWVQLPGIA